MRQLSTLVELDSRRKYIISTITALEDLTFKDKTLITRLLMLSDEFKMTNEERETLGYFLFSEAKDFLAEDNKEN